jgi:hypothetical protein
MILNIRLEVEEIIGRKLAGDELRAFQEMREIGYANPYDIADMLKEW